MYTYHYMQPEAYRFSLDSVRFAEFVAGELSARPDLSQVKVLDLCAGCGVIGFELTWHLRELRHVDFIEVQSVYASYFQQNCDIVNRSELQLQWREMNYEELEKPEWRERYDLILCNPPYFMPHQGTLSPSEFKNRCRFYLDSTFDHLIKAMINALTEEGSAYFLLRSLKQNGSDLYATLDRLLQCKTVTWNKIASVRGNDIVQLQKQRVVE